MRVRHIKFSAVNPLNGSTRQVQWSLGLGPCGRWVESLDVDITLAVVTIKQISYAKDHNGLTFDAMASMSGSAENWLKGPGLEYSKALDENVRSVEIKTFIYKLEDVRGRIEALEVTKR